MAKSDLYKRAGVDIDAKANAMKRAKNLIKSTFNRNVATDIDSIDKYAEFAQCCS